MKNSILPRLASPLLLALSLVACGGGGGSSDGTATTVVPAFSLLDVNAASVRAGEPVSPRDYLGKVTAWYFGAAT